ncbi:MAG: S1/P1 nuclease [Flavobacteriaceae bacterium]
MKKSVLLVFLVCNLTYGTTPFWSKIGHRVIGEVAQAHLNGRAKRAINKLLNGQSLAAVSNFADEMKADTTYRKFRTWHYVNFPADKKYTDVVPSKYGDLVVGIQKCIAIVKDENSSKADKIFYLKMLIHLVGDLHQPMHVGRRKDKGGNATNLQWFNRNSNLHRVWDTELIKDHGMSYSELAEALPKLTKKEKKAIQKGDVYDWVEESQEMANELYESVEEGEKLYYQYGYKWWGSLEIQLEKGGLRLAKILNELF